FAGLPGNIKKSNPNLQLIVHCNGPRKLMRSYTDEEKAKIKAVKIADTIKNFTSEQKKNFEPKNVNEKQIWIETYLMENKGLPFYEPDGISKNGNDNMGCFGGGLIVSQFRKHPCVGIPTTSKNKRDI